MSDGQDPALQEYRKHCISAEQKAQEDYDKAVLALSGGALGVSFAFVKDIAGPGPMQRPYFLLAAWIAWGASVVAALASYWFSQRALRLTIKQVDAQRIRGELPGLAYTRTTEILNALAGLLFVSGVVLIVIFVGANVGRIHTEERRDAKAATALSSSRVVKLLSVGPFDDADSVLTGGNWVEVERALKDGLRQFGGNSTAVNVLVLGAVDRRSLNTNAAHRFGSNEALATARGAAVRARIAQWVGDSISVFVIPTGALQLGRSAEGLELGRDRRVDLYLLICAQN